MDGCGSFWVVPRFSNRAVHQSVYLTGSSKSLLNALQFYLTDGLNSNIKYFSFVKWLKVLNTVNLKWSSPVRT